MKVVGKQVPQWAIDLTKQVCEDHNRALPGELIWDWTGGIMTAGLTQYSRYRDGRQIYKYVGLKNGKFKRRAFRGKVKVVAGLTSRKEDQKLVLLHELAHWVSYRGANKGHTTKFWKKAFELYQTHGLDMDKAFSREKHYKKTAVTVYNKHYKSE